MDTLRVRVPIQRFIIAAEKSESEYVELSDDQVKLVYHLMLTTVFPETRPAYLTAIESLEEALGITTSTHKH